MAMGEKTEKQRVRIFVIEPRQWLRCFQLLAEGGRIVADPFPPTVQIVAAGETEVDGKPAFSLVLKHDSYEETTFINTNGSLAAVGVGMPRIIFSLDEALLANRPTAPEIQDSAVSALALGTGEQITQETLHLLTYQVLPYQIIRLFSLLAAGIPLQTPFFPPEMTFLYGVYNAADGVFLLLCEHPSFAPCSVEVKRVDGVIMSVRGQVPHSKLDIDDSALD